MTDARAPTEHAGVHVPPPLIYVAGLLAGFGLQAVRPLPTVPPAAGRIAGLLGTGAWLALAGPSIQRFRRARTSIVPIRPTTALVTSGPYRYTRNPMYVGLTALYAGVAAWRDNPWALLLLPAVLTTVDRYVIAREERYLEGAFGDEYRRYRSRVPRWL
jgi:protein-S-isoprenylcysteine O-methyltransferase Ste14